jgi:hypothetical protein
MILKKYRKGNQIYALLKCDYCNQEVEILLHTHSRRKRFCSNKCVENYFNKKRLFYKKCLFCKNDFKVSLSNRKKAKFCSKSCYLDYNARKRQDIIDSIELLQSQRIPYKEIAIRMGISYVNLIAYIRRYKLSRGSDRLKSIKARKWSDSEIAIAMEHIEKSQKGDSLSELVSKLDHPRCSIVTKLSKLRKQLAGG